MFYYRNSSKNYFKIANILYKKITVTTNKIKKLQYKAIKTDYIRGSDLNLLTASVSVFN